MIEAQAFELTTPAAIGKDVPSLAEVLEGSHLFYLVWSKRERKS